MTAVIKVAENGFVITGSTQKAGKTETNMWLLKAQVDEGSATTDTTTQLTPLRPPLLQ